MTRPGAAGARHRERSGRARPAVAMALAAFVALTGCSGPVISGASAAAAAAPTPAASGRTAGAPQAPAPAGGGSIAPSIPSAPAAPGPDVAPSSPPPAPPQATPSPEASPAASPLPQSQHGFRFRDTVVPMAFPLPTGAGYKYVNNFLAPRLGTPHPYNNVRGRAPDGTLLRAHDGVDVYVPLGTSVAAPFAGTVIDPATRWKPWDPAMYGRVVAIVSDEEASSGYTVFLVHLSRQLVRPGDHVKRGQRVGFTGNTGNAAGTAPHLHVELRAPFLLRVREFGVVRMIDAFDPFPSLVASDPRRRS